MTWMNPEPIRESEISQKEKSKYHTLTHVCGIYKDGTDELICRGVMETHGEGNGAPLQYSCLEIPMDGGAWQAAVRGVAESQT